MKKKGENPNSYIQTLRNKTKYAYSVENTVSSAEVILTS